MAAPGAAETDAPPSLPGTGAAPPHAHPALLALFVTQQDFFELSAPDSSSDLSLSKKFTSSSTEMEPQIVNLRHLVWIPQAASQASAFSQVSV